MGFKICKAYPQGFKEFLAQALTAQSDEIQRSWVLRLGADGKKRKVKPWVGKGCKDKRAAQGDDINGSKIVRPRN
jgi:hypothetical protein